MSEATPEPLPSSEQPPQRTERHPEGQPPTSEHPLGQDSDTERAAAKTQPIVEDTGATRLPSLPGYEIEGELGRGGMGVVYKARQLSLNRTVALKMIRDSSLAGDKERARFRVEAEAAARLQHPNIVQIYDLREHEGQPFFAMEYVPGGTLAQLLYNRPQPPRRAAELVEALARAVHYAHQQGIVHRDLKPANVLLAFSDASEKRRSAERFSEASLNLCVPKISDFGLAKTLDSASGVTPSTAILGTPSYMAPEQARGKGKDIGPWTDVWALGAILYEALTGRPPFEGESLVQTIDQVRFQEPVPPSRSQPDVPADLEAICLRCLQKEPARRYPSAAALAEDLQHFLAGRPLAAVRPNDTSEVASVPGYEIEEELARGGVWVVYRAREVRSRRPVALKRIRAGSPLASRHLARLRETVAVARELQHPNIAAIYDAGGGALAGVFLALEMIEGDSLHQKTLGQTLPPADVARLIETLARAVHHAHQTGLVHCHLQTTNVLLASGGCESPVDQTGGLHPPLAGCVPKIIGFEMARRRDDTAGANDLNDVRPTSYAMAPEQLFNRPEDVGPATDVYALGVMLYELLTGRPPYRATTTSDLLLKVGFEILQPPRRLREEVPAALDRICMKCLEAAPAERYASAALLADDLCAFLEGKPTLAGGTPFWQKLLTWFRSRLKRL